MSYNPLSFPNRTICNVLDEIRDAHKCHNYSYLSALIEEVQSMANRMEAKLCDLKDFKEAEKIRKKLKTEIDQLNKEIDKKLAEKEDGSK